MTQNRAGDWIQTFSGRRFYPADPRPDDMDIGDVAHALSMVCRFNGHVRFHYSVAQHAVLSAWQAAWLVFTGRADALTWPGQ
jgi:hypothetical protein